MKLEPNHRFDAVQTAVEKGSATPTEPLEKELFLTLKGKGQDETVQKALDIYQDNYKREVIESFLLVDVSRGDIEKVLGVLPSVVDAFEHLFFDTVVFENRLDKFSYARSYDRNDYGHAMKNAAMDYGGESLKISMSAASSYVSPTAVQNEVRAVAYFMAQRAKTNSVDSNVARAALDWAKLALRAAEGAKEESTAGVEQISIALEIKNETTNAENSGIEPDDILR